MPITIAAVGDLLMKSEIIASRRQSGGYRFEPIFAKVRPYFKKHDIAIGNLETTFSGNRKLGVPPKCRSGRCLNERINPRTGYPMLTCPDELGSALKKTGFHVLTTANNHCMDGGAAGLKRTLRVLDRIGHKHTGTFRTSGESRKLLVLRKQGVRIGILSYTYGTNLIPVPKRFYVNRIDEKKISADIRRIKRQTDFLIVCLHFGKEFQTYPSRSQKALMRRLFTQGVNVILGAHPHVLHPVAVYKMKDADGKVRTRVAASSLGNFVSTTLLNNPRTIRGMILSLTLTTNKRGVTDVSKVEQVPTLVQKRQEKGRTTYQVVPIKKK